jgi:type III secretion protein L
MKLFELIEKDLDLRLTTKIIPQKEYSQLLEVKELLEKANKEVEKFNVKAQKKAEQLKQEAQDAGFQEGLLKWAVQLEALESRIKGVRKEFEDQMIELVISCTRKVVGNELKSNKNTILNIVKNSLKPVSTHKFVTIFCNKEDLKLLEKNKSALKEVLEQCQTLNIEARKEVEKGGCIIETEAGIINAELKMVFENLTIALKQYLKK